MTASAQKNEFDPFSRFDCDGQTAETGSHRSCTALAQRRAGNYFLLRS